MKATNSQKSSVKKYPRLSYRYVSCLQHDHYLHELIVPHINVLVNVTSLWTSYTYTRAERNCQLSTLQIFMSDTHTCMISSQLTSISELGRGT